MTQIVSSGPDKRTRVQPVGSSCRRVRAPEPRRAKTSHRTRGGLGSTRTGNPNPPWFRLRTGLRRDWQPQIAYDQSQPMCPCAVVANRPSHPIPHDADVGLGTSPFVISINSPEDSFKFPRPDADDIRKCRRLTEGRENARTQPEFQEASQDAGSSDCLVTHGVRFSRQRPCLGRRRPHRHLHLVRTLLVLTEPPSGGETT